MVVEPGVDPADLVTVIARHPAVEECAVVVRDGTPTGYVVPRRQPPVDPRRLAERLRADLPSYLVPATIVPVERLPRAADGTVDRAALPQPAAEPSRPSSAQPRDEREATVLDCFRRVLGRPSLGMTDGFFDNGGSSRMALRLVAEIERDLGCQVRQRVRCRTAGCPPTSNRRRRTRRHGTPGACCSPGPPASWARSCSSGCSRCPARSSRAWSEPATTTPPRRGCARPPRGTGTSPSSTAGSGRSPATSPRPTSVWTPRVTRRWRARWPPSTTVEPRFPSRRRTRRCAPPT